MGPLRLTLLRHGEAQPGECCPEDFERALTRRGTLQAREMAARLAHRDLVPDLILTSPSERTWATAAILADALELDAKQVQAARELYLATAETTWRVLTRRHESARHLLVCGHNPGLSQLASRLGPTRQRLELPTAGLATAFWHHAAWSSLQPETASSCELDDPEAVSEPRD